MQITLKTNAPEVAAYVAALAADQIPFATSKAINETAKAIKRTEQKKIPEHFENRTGWLLKSGAMPLKYSNKRQYPQVFATLRVVDEVAALAATGGERKSGTGKMSVPFANAGAGQSARALINPARRTLPPSKWPSRIAAPTQRRKSKRGLKPKPFMLKSKSGRHYVAQRAAIGRSRLLFLYGFKRTVKIKKTWPLLNNAENYIDRNFDRRFKLELQRAIQTAR